MERVLNRTITATAAVVGLAGAAVSWVSIGCGFQEPLTAVLVHAPLALSLGAAVVCWTDYLESKRARKPAVPVVFPEVLEGVSTAQPRQHARGKGAAMLTKHILMFGAAMCCPLVTSLLPYEAVHCSASLPRHLYEWLETAALTLFWLQAAAIGAYNKVTTGRVLG